MGRVKEWLMDKTDEILHRYVTDGRSPQAFDEAFKALSKLAGERYARECLGDPEPRPFEL